MRHRLRLNCYNFCDAKKTKKIVGRQGPAREDVLFMGVTPHRPLTRTIEQIRQEQAPPDLLLADRFETKLSATFKCRLF